MKLSCLSIAASLGVVFASAARAEDKVVVLPDVDITTQAPTSAAPTSAAPAPAAAYNFLQDTSPSNNQHVDAAEIARTGSPFVGDVLERVVPGVTTPAPSGNPLAPDVVYRGFVASPVSGTPQGLAVYQNGVRINEAFGDQVNFDMIPTFAIASMDLVTNNPAFGLNALGGALNIRMKDGFNFSGGKFVVQGGSYDRAQGGFEYGKQIDNWAIYVALEAVHDNGYRDFGSSLVQRFYGDLGYRAEGNETHLSVGLADNLFGVAGTSPLQMLQQDWGATYTTPQTNRNEMGMVTLSDKFTISPTWSVAATAYVRRFVQQTQDGNPTNVQQCNDPTLLCFNDAVTPANGLNGQQLQTSSIPNPNNLPLGEIDRTGTLTTTLGTSAQLSNTDSLFGYKNHVSFGASYDYSRTTFDATAELGVVQPNYVVDGSGVFLGPSGNPVADGPVNIQGISRYFGVNLLDAFDISDKLTLSAGARLNMASISLFDELGGNAGGEHEYTHINPVIGLTYKITPNLQAYASFAESNRAPTPLELGCANPQQPCILASFLVNDPNLQQVVAQTFEAGFRGQNDLANDWGSVGWKLGAFHTLSTNDIENIPDPFQQGFGYFANVGDTLREGIEAQFNYKKGPFDFHASYTYLNAVYLSALTLASNSPSADANGNIYVVPGDQIPMIPRHTLKLGGDWDITSKARLGADLLFVGPQHFAGDNSNQQPLLPSYFTVSLNGSYKLTDQIELFGRIENLLDRRYYLYGGYFDTSQLFQAFTNPQAVTPAQPFSVYGGVRMSFDAPAPAPVAVATKY